jgi:CheY-like chemotaxis protein
MHRVRVLIADAEKDHAETLGMLFELRGCVVHSTSDSHTALELITAHRPDVVILELDLRGAGAVCRAAREANPLGAYIAGIVGLAPDACMCDVALVKPYRFDELVDGLEQFIAQRVRLKKAANGGLSGS